MKMEENEYEKVVNDVKDLLTQKYELNDDNKILVGAMLIMSVLGEYDDLTTLYDFHRTFNEFVDRHTDSDKNE